MKSFCLFCIATILISCSSMKKTPIYGNGQDVIFKESFNETDIEKHKEKFFVLSGSYTFDPLGERNTIASRFNGNTENSLLFGPENLTNYSLEASFFFLSTANNTVAAGMGGGGIAGFKVQLFPTGQQTGRLRLLYNGVIYDEVELRMTADSWYRIRLDLKTEGSQSTVSCVAYKEGQDPKNWMIKGKFRDLDLKGQVRLLSFPVRGMPVYIDDVVIRKND